MKKRNDATENFQAVNEKQKYESNLKNKRNQNERNIRMQMASAKPFK
jgi:hypothetical protein